MKRVLVIGNSGSGKSTWAKRLAEKTSLPLTHLDTVFWVSDTLALTRIELDTWLAQTLRQQQWILDGTYLRTLPWRLEYADTVVFLDFPRWQCLWQALISYIKQILRPQKKLKSGNPAKFSLKFLWWILTYPRQEVLVHLLRAKHVRVLHFRSAKKVERWLETVR